MSGKISLTQVINLWKNFHSVVLTAIQRDKLEAAFLLVSEESYNAGKKQGYKDALDAEDVQRDRDSVYGKDSTS